MNDLSILAHARPPPHIAALRIGKVSIGSRVRSRDTRTKPSIRAPKKVYDGGDERRVALFESPSSPVSRRERENGDL